MRHALALCSLFSVYFSSVLVCSVAADVSEHSGGVVKCPPAPCNPPNGTAAVPQLHALPADGAVVSGTSSLAVQWSVQCIAYPCASYVVYWDVNGGDEDALVPGVRIDGATSLSLHNLEPGSYFLRLTLHDAATDEQLAAHVSSLEVVPVAAPAVDPVYVSMTQAAAGPGGDPTPLPLPRGVAEDAVPAPAVLFVGDTATFDGMKSFLVDYMAAFARRGSHVGYLDATCMAPDVDTAGVFASPPAPGATFPSPVAQAVLAVPGVRFMRWCVQCPRQLCSSASDFDAFVDRHGPLPNAASWDDLPAAWAALLRPLGDVIGSFDAMVMAWTEDKPQGRGMYLSHVGRLSNPALVRVVDLGPGYERLPEEFWSADAFTVPSNFVKLRPTVTATGMEAIVMQPLIDARRFRPDATHVSADSCARKYGKLVGTDGGVLVGFVARVTSTKGPGMFVRAAAEVVKRLPNARFVMVGQPRQHVYMEHLQWLVDKLGLTRHVRMFGFLPRHELMDLYACMDVLLCTSLTNYETFGIVNAEAMAMEVPVVHFGVAGVQDYALDGVHSELARAWDAPAVAAAVAKVAVKSAAMGRAARQFVLQHLSEAVTAPRLHAVFKRKSLEARVDALAVGRLALEATGQLVAAGGPDPALLMVVSARYALSVSPASVAELVGVPPADADAQRDAFVPMVHRLLLDRHARSVACFAVVPVGGAAGMDVATCAPFADVIPNGNVTLLVPQTGVHTVHAWVTRSGHVHRQQQVSLTVKA